MDKKINGRVFSSKEACKYLGIDFSLFRYHVYEMKHLQADFKVAHSLVFTQETLDEFKRRHMGEGLTLKQAAEYLGVEVTWVRNHIFNTKLLVADGKRGRKSIFTHKTLDAIKTLIPQEEQKQEPEQERELVPA